MNLCFLTFLNWLSFCCYDNVDFRLSQKCGKEMLAPDADTFCTAADNLVVKVPLYSAVCESQGYLVWVITLKYRKPWL
jgi:hypothetical protein